MASDHLYHFFAAQWEERVMKVLRELVQLPSCIALYLMFDSYSCPMNLRAKSSPPASLTTSKLLITFVPQVIYSYWTRRLAPPAVSEQISDSTEPSVVA